MLNIDETISSLVEVMHLSKVKHHELYVNLFYFLSELILGYKQEVHFIKYVC